MSEYDAIEFLEELITDKPILEMYYSDGHEKAVRMAIKALEKQMNSKSDCDHDCAKCWKTELVKPKWIPFKEREADPDEREAYGCDMMLDCKIPDEDEDILVTYASGRVGFDTFLREGYECYLDSGAQFITEAIAWMPLPEPYKEEVNQ